MDKLAELYPSSEDSDADRQQAPVHLQETDLGDGTRPGKRPRRAEGGNTPADERMGRKEIEAWHQGTLCESLQRLQEHDVRWPSPSLAVERKQTWAWFAGVCNREFAAELASQPQVVCGHDAGLRVFGSETCNVWVKGSDIDCNMCTHQRIPNFFVRLKKAVGAGDAAAKVDVISTARVPVAKVLRYHRKNDNRIHKTYTYTFTCAQQIYKQIYRYDIQIDI